MNVTFGDILLKLQMETYRKLYNIKFESTPFGTGDRIDTDHL
jgi:hypothetical protein